MTEPRVRSPIPVEPGMDNQDRRRDDDGAAAAGALNQRGAGMLADLAVADARRAGLLDGRKVEHVSFRLPKALVEAAQRETGIRSKTELGIASFSMLAQPDPAVAFQVANFGLLGEDFDLEY